ncbi:MAG TPA: hypothetical protein VFT82_02710 [Candidatus Paceibacterota bacterium]|nr:hypothetical protein [Candidatus Paceibacterota bacterium]
MLSQDATGGRTVVWPGSVTWSSGSAPVLTSTANGVDVIDFIYNGSSYIGIDATNPGSSATSTIAFDSSGGTVTTTGLPTSISWSHTVSGSNRALVVFVYNADGSGGGSDNISSVTYNGTAMTRVNDAYTDNGQRIFGYILLNPVTGTHTISVTTSSSQNQLGGVSLSYTGVRQTSEPEAYSSHDGTNRQLMVFTNVPTANSWVVGATRNSLAAPSAAQGTTIRNTVNTMAGADSGGAVPDGARFLQWNLISAAVWDGVAMSLAPLSN